MGPQNKVPIDVLFLSINIISEQTRVHFDKLSRFVASRLCIVLIFF